MVSATNGIQSSNSFSLPFPTAGSMASLDSFEQQLSTALEGYLGKLESGANVSIQIQSNPSQNPGTRQFTVTVTDPTLMASDTSTPMSIPTIPTSNSSVSSTTPPPTDQGTPIDKSKMTPTDAYWAEQPPAVQQLRYCPDDQRFPMAQELFKQGYSIDMPIMVWGWDPLATMTLRQNEGYTWVPSAFQPNIPIGPGIINVWNLPSYDPNNPPPGSIKVSTDFANGTNGQDPWMKTLTSET